MLDGSFLTNNLNTNSIQFNRWKLSHNNSSLDFSFDNSVSSHIPSSKKVLCLHGGGGSAAAFRSHIHHLTVALPDFEFIFAESPEFGNVWLRDPPYGKNTPTTDPLWANTSINYLNQFVHDNGPFYALLGYSQGCAMALVYLAYSHFHKVFLFNGYVPSTHTGLLNSIDSLSPFSIPAFVFSGQYDYTISKSMSDVLASKFLNVTRVHSSSAGHHLPSLSDPSFPSLVHFFRSGLFPST